MTTEYEARNDMDLVESHGLDHLDAMLAHARGDTAPVAGDDAPSERPALTGKIVEHRQGGNPNPQVEVEGLNVSMMDEDEGVASSPATMPSESSETAHVGPIETYTEGSYESPTGRYKAPRNTRMYTGNRRTWHHTEQDHIREPLIADLAAGEMSNQQLADKYDVAQPTINNFKRRHLDDIATVRRQNVEKINDLWIAEKKERLAEYQRDVSMINDEVMDLTDPTAVAAARRVKHSALRNSAEELGDLPARAAVQVNNVQVNYSISGVDVEGL